MDKFFAKFANATAHVAGTPAVFLICVVVVLVWAVSGPFFGFSETWQLVINTGTTIVTFLMVFLIQRTQNKDSLAIQLKLDEIVAVMAGASNRLIGCEDLNEEELHTLRRHYETLVELAKKEGSLTMSHSVEEAEERHERKTAGVKTRR